jgi:hypothetical protein
MGDRPIRSGRLDASPKHSLFLFITEQHNSRAVTSPTARRPTHTTQTQLNTTCTSANQSPLRSSAPSRSSPPSSLSRLSAATRAITRPRPPGAAATHATATKGETLASASSHCVRKRRCSCSPPVTQCAGFGICRWRGCSSLHHRRQRLERQQRHHHPFVLKRTSEKNASWLIGQTVELS